MMTWAEAVRYCESHGCKECIAYPKIDCRSKFDKEILHIPCCINLVSDELRYMAYDNKEGLTIDE